MDQNQIEGLVLGVFFFERSKPFHQATFSPGSVVPVKDAFFGSLVQGADGHKRGSTGFFQAAILDQVFCFPHESACPAAMDAVAQPALLVLLVAFYG
jgi:hypothetical protein